MYAAIKGMVCKDKNELKQYLTCINPIYAKYTDGLWAEELTSVAPWKPIMRGVYDTLHLFLIPRECTPSDADLVLRIEK